MLTEEELKTIAKYAWVLQRVDPNNTFIIFADFFEFFKQDYKNTHNG